MSEEQKYQGALYKEKNNKKQKNQHTPNRQNNGQGNAMAHNMYVEDVDETWKEYQAQTDDGNSPAALPEAPTPPAAVNDDHVNVFDFMVATGQTPAQTPNASSLNLARDLKELEASESTCLVRYEHTEDDYLTVDADIQYGNGSYETPAPSKHERRKKDGEKTDKKRKRLHVEVHGDEEMTDAPPVLHSGLTGGLKGLIVRPELPPSPDYSGGDVAETPASPLKKSKHSKHSKHGQFSNSIFGMLSGSKVKSKKRKTSSTKKSSSRHHQEKENKLIEYRPQSKNGDDSAMVVFKPRADVFFNFVNKGPESDRGCSMNKALKRFHRERTAAGTPMSKHVEEKELWRSIRLRRNDRGEIVLFSI